MRYAVSVMLCVLAGCAASGRASAPGESLHAFLRRVCELPTQHADLLDAIPAQPDERLLSISTFGDEVFIWDFRLRGATVERYHASDSQPCKLYYRRDDPAVADTFRNLCGLYRAAPDDVREDGDSALTFTIVWKDGQGTVTKGTPAFSTALGIALGYYETTLGHSGSMAFETIYTRPYRSQLELIDAALVQLDSVCEAMYEVELRNRADGE